MFYLQVRRDLSILREPLTDARTRGHAETRAAVTLQVANSGVSVALRHGGKASSHVLFNHLAHQGDSRTLFQKSDNFSSAQEILKVSASTGSLPGLL